MWISDFFYSMRNWEGIFVPKKERGRILSIKILKKKERVRKKKALKTYKE